MRAADYRGDRGLWRVDGEGEHTRGYWEKLSKIIQIKSDEMGMLAFISAEIKSHMFQFFTFHFSNLIGRIGHACFHFRRDPNNT